MEVPLTVFDLAEREDVDVELIFRFAWSSFATSEDNSPDFDYELYTRGEMLPHYVQDLLEYEEKRRDGHLH